MKQRIATFVLKLIITLIVGQTLFFKFSGAEESIYIFHTLGVEPWGRIALGGLELFSLVILWIPQTYLYALLLIEGMMWGAVASHLFILGIEIEGDGGELFVLALVTAFSAAAILYLHRTRVALELDNWLGR